MYNYLKKIFRFVLYILTKIIKNKFSQFFFPLKNSLKNILENFPFGSRRDGKERG
jgi:hypothetical protein